MFHKQNYRLFKAQHEKTEEEIAREEASFGLDPRGAGMRGRNAAGDEVQWDQVLVEQITLEPMKSGGSARILGTFLEEVRIISHFLPQREQNTATGIS